MQGKQTVESAVFSIFLEKKEEEKKEKQSGESVIVEPQSTKGSLHWILQNVVTSSKQCHNE